MPSRVSLSLALLLILSTIAAGSALATIYLAKGALTSGGGVTSGGSFVAEGSLGEPFIGQVSGGSYQQGVGFWYVVFEDRAVGVEDGSGLTPMRYRLDQNYPNPFNPVTTIRFALPEQGHVRLRLFDLRGREVAVLIDEEMNAGEHSLVIRSEGLASGVYVYRFEAGEFSDSRRFTLVK